MFLFAEEGGAHHAPLIVEFINHYLGKPVHEFQIAYTKPFWDNLFSRFGTNAETVFGQPYTVENAIPWYTIMFAIACILTLAAIWIFVGKHIGEKPHAERQRANQITDEFDQENQRRDNKRHQ